MSLVQSKLNCPRGFNLAADGTWALNRTWPKQVTEDLNINLLFDNHVAFLGSLIKLGFVEEGAKLPHDKEVTSSRPPAHNYIFRLENAALK